MNTDMIVAQATPPGVSGVSIVRVSGQAAQVRELIPVLTGLSSNNVLPRHAKFTHFYDANRLKIDEGIVIYFDAPHSYTGETVLEFQGHGGVIAPRLIIQACLDLGCRLANPGEFSLRAVLNNKMTTLQAEAICGLIHADDEAQARAALRSMRGDFAQIIEDIESQIKHFRVMIETSIDFDDEDINPDICLSQLEKICKRIETIYVQTKEAVSVNHDQQICLIGAPNAGKSSWLNQLIGDEVAIVSAEAGTTRDLIEKRLFLKDRWVQITDTAGLRGTQDSIEKEGVRRAKEKTQSVDLIVWVVDVDRLDDLDAMAASLPEHPSEHPERYLVLWNKRDKHGLDACQYMWGKVPVHMVSALSVADVMAVRKLIGEKITHPTADGFYARQRHLISLKKINQIAHDILQGYQDTYDVVWVAECMREVQEELDKLTGLFSTDDLLGEIFGSFCIGK